jgi:hypothetical protein
MLIDSAYTEAAVSSWSSASAQVVSRAFTVRRLPPPVIYCALPAGAEARARPAAPGYLALARAGSGIARAGWR